MVKVFIADDHAIVREGLKGILRTDSLFQLMGEAATAQETLNWVQAHACDLLVLDLSFPDGNGIELLKEVKRRRPEVSVLVLSAHAEEQFALRALRAGAAGYLNKQSLPEELLLALRKVAKGGKYVSAAVAERLVGELGGETQQAPHTQLSDREMEVFLGIASGKSTAQIGVDLGISETTVSTYRSRVLKKMNLKTNAEIIHYALRNQLID